MTTTQLDRSAVRPRTFLRELDGRPALARFGPGWFTTVMGTGIVATAAATLPVTGPAALGLLGLARATWVAAALLLVVVVVATARHWHDHRATAVGHLDDPATAPFYGAPAMALMTVGAGALLVGVPVVGLRAAVALDAVLWTAGTLLGLWVAVAVTVRSFVRDAARPRQVGPVGANGTGLLAVVPPMVSAATGPLLLPHLPAGQPRLTLLCLCLALFGTTLVASLVVLSQVWDRLLRDGVGPAATVPALWIVLGPLGQSVTAAHHLGLAAPDVLPAPYGRGLAAAALVVGLPIWGFAMFWLAVVGCLTVRAARAGLPFSMGWWAFTFPVGTVVTGTSALADVTGAGVLVAASVVLFVGLLAAWLVVAARTAHGVYVGRLLRG